VRSQNYYGVQFAELNLYGVMCAVNGRRRRSGSAAISQSTPYWTTFARPQRRSSPSEYRPPTTAGRQGQEPLSATQENKVVQEEVRHTQKDVLDPSLASHF